MVYIMVHFNWFLGKAFSKMKACMNTFSYQSIEYNTLQLTGHVNKT